MTKSKTVLACGSSPEKAVPTRRKLLIDCLRYISIQTTNILLLKKDNCLFRRHPHTPASCVTVRFGSNHGHVTRK